MLTHVQSGRLSSPAGDRFLQVLVVGCALFEFKREPRRVVPYHLPNARLKRVEEVEPASLPIVELLSDTYRTVNDARCLHRSGTRLAESVFFLQDLLWAGELFVTLHLVHGGVALLTLPVCHDRGTVQLVRKRALRPRT